MLTEQDVSALLLQDKCISADLYHQVFHSDPYSFPSLSVDEQGLFTAATDSFQSYDHVVLNKTQRTYQLPDGSLPRDLELERAIADHRITCVDIDLDKGPVKHRWFESTRCSVYPECIKDIPVIYDTLFLTDYLLKFVYRVFSQMVVLGYSLDQIYSGNYILSYRELNGTYAISSIFKRPGFAKLLNTIRLFSLKNKLPQRRSEIYASYQASRDQDLGRLNLSFPTLTFATLEDDLYMFPLQPKATFTTSLSETPLHMFLLLQFIHEHYSDLKNAFPIYYRMENIYRLCALETMRQRSDWSFDSSLTIKDEPRPLRYTRTFPDKIMCCGGVTLAPKNIQHCKDAFNNGGFICAFAPKLTIRECYDKNLKAYHDCLAAEEQ